MKTLGKTMCFFLFLRIFLEDKICLSFLIILDVLVIWHLILLSLFYL